MAKVFRLSALVGLGAALSFAVFFSNCGGSGGMRTGAAGSTGTAGSGSAGSTGSAGATGTGGTGTGGKFMCAAASPDLTCGASALKLPDGHVLAFSAEEWTPMDGKYCNGSGLRGAIFPYSTPAGDAGATASASAAVDVPTGAFKLNLMVGPGDYAGGGLAFDRCVDASDFGALRFTAWIASGDLTGCPFVTQLQTFEQRPTNASPPGGCDPAGTCYSLPSAPVTLTTSPTTFTVKFSDYTTSATQAMPAAGQIVALQWQITSGDAPDDASAQPSCTAEVHIDDVDFVAAP